VRWGGGGIGGDSERCCHSNGRVERERERER
jgi:hypothetical protein